MTIPPDTTPAVARRRDPDEQYPRKPKSIDRIIGSNLRKLRREKSINQATVAECIGVSFPQLQKYETGANRISVSTLLRLTEVLGIEPQDFLTRVCADIAHESLREKYGARTDRESS